MFGDDCIVYVHEIELYVTFFFYLKKIEREDRDKNQKNIFIA